MAGFERYVVIVEVGTGPAAARILERARAELGSIIAPILATDGVAVFGVVTDLHAGDIVDVMRHGDKTLRAAVFSIGNDYSIASKLGTGFAEIMSQFPVWKSRRDDDD